LNVSKAQTNAEKYYLKAMNCPHHHRILPRSRALSRPAVALREDGTNYRYEQSGELFGLMRVRSLVLNGAHIYLHR
jgi:threonyl-tRNA synthetase